MTDRISGRYQLYLSPTTRSAAAGLGEALAGASVTAKDSAAPKAKTTGWIIPKDGKDRAAFLQKAAEDATPFPIGWKTSNVDAAFQPIVNGFSWVMGILVSAVAVSLGAPFWFDVLKLVVNVRSNVAPPERKPEDNKDSSKGTAPAVSPTAKEKETTMPESATESGLRVSGLAGNVVTVGGVG